MKRLLKALVVPLLTLEARLVLKRREPRVAVVSGSVGKTSTKDALATALGAKFSVRKSAKSFNSDIGVPLTILDLPNGWNNPIRWFKNLCYGLYEIFAPGEYPEWLVLEVGADAPGDLQKLFAWLSPDLVVITRFPDVPVHVEFYESPEALIKEESIPAERIKSRGVLTLNFDDPKVRALKDNDRARVTTYGFEEGGVVRGEGLRIRYEDGDIVGSAFSVCKDDKKGDVLLQGGLGIQHAYPVLAAIAAGLELGIGFDELLKAFTSHTTPPGRMRALRGIHGSSLIDDTYNSSPIALTEALKVLRGTEGFKRKIAVLGDMLELGSYSKDAHTKAGEEAAEVADILVAVGVRAKDILLSAKEKGTPDNTLFHFTDASAAADFMEKLVEEGDVVLVKGSQGIRLEKVVAALLRNPEERERALVRQEREWITR